MTSWSTPWLDWIVSALGELRTGLVTGVRRIWAAHNLTFLLVLGLGMVTSVILLAQALSVALESIRPVVWGFFLGIIVLSIWMLGRNLAIRALLRMAPAGILAGVGVVLLDPFSGAETLPVFFLAGAVAVSAWLLPAVSGSFVLLTIGLYEAVIGALVTPHWDVLLLFLSGCAVGLLLFSRALSVLLHRWRDPLLAFLTGFMAGASLQLWPWQAEGGLVERRRLRGADGRSGAAAGNAGRHAGWRPDHLAVVQIRVLTRREGLLSALQQFPLVGLTDPVVGIRQRILLFGDVRPDLRQLLVQLQEIFLALRVARLPRRWRPPDTRVRTERSRCTHPGWMTSMFGPS